MIFPSNEKTAVWLLRLGLASEKLSSRALEKGAGIQFY
jgi:hypothetical protein